MAVGTGNDGDALVYRGVPPDARHRGTAQELTFQLSSFLPMETLLPTMCVHLPPFFPSTLAAAPLIPCFPGPGRFSLPPRAGSCWSAVLLRTCGTRSCGHRSTWRLTPGGSTPSGVTSCADVQSMVDRSPAVGCGFDFGNEGVSVTGVPERTGQCF